MKPHIRVLGIDDAPFKFEDKYTTVVGAVVRVPSYLEGVLSTRVEIDGMDSTEKLTNLISESRYREQLRLVMLDGIALGGFNVVDINKVYADLNIPTVTITRDKPDLSSMKNALRQHFKDWEARFEIISRSKPQPIQTKHSPIFVQYVGITLKELETLIAQTTVRGVLPEPLRVAHVIATGITVGESYGRA